MKKLQNFWFYYKKHLLIALAALLVLGYLTWQDGEGGKPDYHIGLVCGVQLTDGDLAALQDRIAAAGVDVNGDGEVMVQIHTYYVDLADDSLNAGVRNEQTIAALDADLTGNVSGIFLVEDVAAFREITKDVWGDEIPGFDGNLYFALRQDADEIYKTLAEKLF